MKLLLETFYHRCIGILNWIFDLYAPSLIKSYFLDSLFSQMYFLDPTPAYQISHFAKTFSPFHSRPIIRSKKTKYILKGQVQILNKTLVFFLFYKRTFYSTITVLVKGSYDTINHSDKGILFVAFQEHVCIHFYRVTIACEGDHNLGCPRGTRTKTVLNWGILKKKSFQQEVD